ncbi:MAG: hypothetical protein KDD83_08285 [Caldilineaceae bacterium]|nr:hypothetical protein [Caldilineaceae bacterium]
MFQTPRFLQNSFSITFARISDIRRRANAVEDALHQVLPGHYTIPQVIPVPDELDPEVPRLLFGSTHGYSQILISQISLVLNVQYSPDWQADIARGEAYLRERVPPLFSVLAALHGATPLFAGLTTLARTPTRPDVTDAMLLNLLAQRTLHTDAAPDMFDLQVKTTRIVDEHFYSNVTVKNFRGWPQEQMASGVVPISTTAAVERGIELHGDFNDRYRFNESPDYTTDADSAHTIITRGIATVVQELQAVQEG